MFSKQENAWKQKNNKDTPKTKELNKFFKKYISFTTIFIFWITKSIYSTARDRSFGICVKMTSTQIIRSLPLAPYHYLVLKKKKNPGDFPFINFNSVMQIIFSRLYRPHQYVTKQKQICKNCLIFVLEFSRIEALIFQLVIEQQTQQFIDTRTKSNFVIQRKNANSNMLSSGWNQKSNEQTTTRTKNLTKIP